MLQYPPAEAAQATRAMLAWVWDHRHEGITFGGAGLRGQPTIAANLMSNLNLEDGAPADPCMATDATWDDDPAYGILLTDNGGAVLHSKKSLRLAVVSSTEAEGAGAAKGSEIIEVYMELLRAQRRMPAEGIALCLRTIVPTLWLHPVWEMRRACDTASGDTTCSCSAFSGSRSASVSCPTL